MSTVGTAAATIHLLTGAAWVGSVVYFAAAVLPAARDGELNAAPVESLADTLSWWSRGASVLMLLTGGYLAGTRYTAETLTGTPRGHAVLGMVVLWLVLTGLVEAGRGRLVRGLQRKKVRQPAAESLSLYRGAAIVGLLLLVDAGYLLS